MSQKTLSIMLLAVDRATAPLRGVVESMGKTGDATAKAGAKMTASLSAINAKLNGVIAAMIGFGAVALAKAGLSAVAGVLDSTTQALDEVGLASQRLGLSVEMLSKLRYAAMLNEVEFGTLTDAVSTAEKNVAMFAATGGGKGAEAIARMGLSVRDAGGNVRTINDLLPEMFDAIAALPQNEQGWITQKLFGSDADRLLYLIRQGGAELRRLGEEARRIGVVFTKDQTDKANAYRDAVDRLSQAWLGVKVALVDKVVPFATSALEKLAVVVASIPDMVRKIAEVLKVAFDADSGVGVGIRLQLNEVVVKGVAVVIAGLKGLVRLAFVTLSAGLPALFELLYPYMLAGGRTLGKAVTDGIGETIQSFGAGMIGSGIPELSGIGAALFGVSTWARKAVENVKPAAEELAGGMQRSIESLNAALADSGSNARVFMQAWRETGDDVYGRGSAFSEAFSRLFKTAEILAQHAIPTVEAFQSAVAPKPETPSQWERLWSAVLRGVENVRSKIQSTADVVTSITERTIESFSSGMSNAIVDAIAGVKSFGEAAREVLSSILRQIAQMITQWLLMRAITGLFPSGQGGGEFTSFIGPVAGANTGGYVDVKGISPSRSILGFARGGVVPGPSINRDIVPAILTPGEGVVNRRGMQRLGRDGLDSLNAGGGSSGGVVINVSVAVQGGSGTGGVDLAAVRRAASAGVLEALRQSPAYRGQMREVLR